MGVFHGKQIFVQFLGVGCIVTKGEDAFDNSYKAVVAQGWEQITNRLSNHLFGWNAAVQFHPAVPGGNAQLAVKYHQSEVYGVEYLQVLIHKVPEIQQWPVSARA